MIGWWGLLNFFIFTWYNCWFSEWQHCLVIWLMHCLYSTMWQCTIKAYYNSSDCMESYIVFPLCFKHPHESKFFWQFYWCPLVAKCWHANPVLTKLFRQEMVHQAKVSHHLFSHRHPEWPLLVCKKQSTIQ